MGCSHAPGNTNLTMIANTDIDVLGPAILRLLKQAERGDPPDAGPEIRLKLSV